MDRRSLLVAALGASVPTLARASGGGDEKKKAPGAGLTYIQLPVLTATILRPSGRRGVMTVETGLDVKDEKLHERTDKLKPRLRAGFAEIVRTYAAGLSPGDLPNADFLARELQMEADRIIGRKGARLMLGSILMN